ncbi:hypothetical protein ABGT16_04960 [Pseudomonas asiatica]|uniref:hypothetical protein n=1 Tax=Pseudomonas asiatica TaxID=2219225 RepID=UPI00345D1396
MDGLEAMLPGESENIYKTALMVAQQGGKIAGKRIHSRTSFFMTLTPAKRKSEMSAILDTLLTMRAVDNPLKSMEFEPLDSGEEYPNFKW